MVRILQDGDGFLVIRGGLILLCASRVEALHLAFVLNAHNN